MAPRSLSAPAPRSDRSGYWISGWPELLAEWHPTRNGGLRPHELSHGSGRKVWWKCPHGPDHEWRASANNRTAGRTGCPFCAGRLPSVTNSLATLRPDVASQWHPTKNRALAPDRVVAGSRRRVWWKCPFGPDHEWLVSIQTRAAGEGACPFCLGLRVSSTNSLASVQPRVAHEWHPAKNGALTPRDVVAGSSLVVWWRCRLQPEHEWRASIANRSTKGSGCPFCSGRRASSEHCLAALYPAIAYEWHPTRNGAVSPATVAPRARLYAWWRCPVGHEWRCRVSDRTRRFNGCPVCASKTRPAPEPPRARPREGGAKPRPAGPHLQGEHRRIEQTLVLLAHDPGVDAGVLAKVVRDVSAHLAAEEALVFPLFAATAAAPLAKLRETHGRMRHLLTRIAHAPAGRQGACLETLVAVFRDHARMVEAETLPNLETKLSGAALRALAERLREAHDDGLRASEPSTDDG